MSGLDYGHKYRKTGRKSSNGEGVFFGDINKKWMVRIISKKQRNKTNGYNLSTIASFNTKEEAEEYFKSINK